MKQNALLEWCLVDISLKHNQGNHDNAKSGPLVLSISGKLVVVWKKSGDASLSTVEIQEVVDEPINNK